MREFYEFALRNLEYKLLGYATLVSLSQCVGLLLLSDIS